MAHGDAVVQLKPLSTTESLSSILNLLDASSRVEDISNMTVEVLDKWANNLAGFVGLKVTSVTEDAIEFIPSPGHRIILDVA
ncbi:hypothetical protein EVB32_224 [Rhizobium phage RHph_TM39]|uniref:Uncharacterized protein n=2 Tax=Cuauhnahuacvirus TaxID=3044696 RepID=A0A7S5R807_9CAUD|nr:hypothetical protein PQC16_gp239 [Rhizobium phage RHph_TM30]YP_010671388.1 hypothetical protein PQC17_gp239 [Rhizobium phage RHph_Y65]QIG71710.1 hypothetical protein EVB94_239 [Rhizobium phage RHph_TM40]QIG72073.1 hypothetical protein EVB95_239 [Rhizobium phage RHph_TM2_3B]QIG72435.1 hypothetical protein EVB96_239 [Rhizobium phage RHph_TM3_3_6]QIG77212.1 hypothetical protein EVB32_224 [Rhizobium phage RHph_TM39]QIG77825.1 hypothetical protein EVB64_238 [Rhizobium phage RHph_TM61]